MAAAKSMSELPGWPALDAGDEPLPEQLTYSRAVWGKVHGVPSDYRWIAANPTFTPQDTGLERELLLGSEDAPHRSQLWRTLGEVHYAVHCYPSRAVDAAVRTKFLEKQVLAWRRLETVPAALGALLLLPRVGEWTDEIWWDRRSDPRFLESDFLVDITSEDSPPVLVSAAAIGEAIAAGIESLARCVPEDVLTELYASLVAGQRAIPLPGLKEPLAPRALAALLLPLPRRLADQLSLAGWPSSKRVEAESLSERWDVVLGDRSLKLKPTGPAATDAQHRQASSMARALLQGDPALLESDAAPLAGGPAAGDQAPVQVALWGPSAAGKTVLLAQLFLYIKTRSDGIDWEVFPSKESQEFLTQMREAMLGSNQFPVATAVGMPERVVYKFSNHKTGAKASLLVEDRAGRDYEKLEKDAQERMRSAAGLVLLFDPTRNRRQLEIEVRKTIVDVHVHSGSEGDRDPRPIAVCVSKADELISSPIDLKRATEDPDGFVRNHERVDPILVAVIEKYCDNYKLFPVSAAGLELRHGVVESPVFYDENLTPRIGRSGEPFNLMAPFAWVLDQVTGS